MEIGTLRYYWHSPRAGMSISTWLMGSGPMTAQLLWFVTPSEAGTM